LLEVFCNDNQLKTAEGGEALLKIDLGPSKRRFDLKSHMMGVQKLRHWGLQMKMSPKKKEKTLRVKDTQS
jgi:hypothetical protein